MAVAIGAALTAITLENTATSAQTNLPITFGQPFKPGDLPTSGANVILRAADNSTVPCQLDVRVSNDDGSVRHAVLSAIIPSLAASQSKGYTIERAAAPATPTPAVLADFPGLDAVATWTEGGTTYTASLAALLGGPKTVWLSGDTVTEWEVWGPLKTAANVEHAHLHARFNVRGYKGQNKARVDAVIENTWARNPQPQDVTGNFALAVGGVTAYSKNTLVHHPRARHRHIAWWNATEPTVHIKHDIPYLSATRATPNYDPATIPSASQATIYKDRTITNGGPMGWGVAEPRFFATGGRPDIGILPGWTALYLISMLKDAKDATLNQGSLAGSWSMHFRDKNTGRVLSFQDWPRFSVTGTPGDNTNPLTGQSELAPGVVSNTNQLAHDVSHHPDQSYVPYLVTGDIYHAEELQFWMMYMLIAQNSDPSIRNGKQGLIKAEQVRGQAWTLRTMAHAAYILPPALGQAEALRLLKSNIDWYDATYTNSTGNAAQLGAIINGYAVVYSTKESEGGTGIAPWQDDHFTASIGRAVELGHEFARPLFNWKAKFTVARLYGVAGTHWQQAAPFRLRVRESQSSANIYTNYSECYQGTFSPAILAEAAKGPQATQEMATAWWDYNAWAVANGYSQQDGVSNPGIGDMDGYSDSPSGYPSNLQHAVAYCASLGASSAAAAWSVFMSRSVKPSYSTEPQFSIVPYAAGVSEEPDPVPEPLPSISETRMAYKDRVKETTVTAGTGPLALGGVPTSEFIAFSPAYSVGERVPYCVALGAQWEVGQGTLTSPTTLARTTVTASSNNGQLVDFAAGTKEVYTNVSADELNQISRSVSARVVYVSKIVGDVAQADLADGSTTFGPDSTAAIQAVLNTASAATPLHLIFDGKYSSTGWRIKGYTAIEALPGCGAILRTGANKSLFENYNITFNPAARVDKNIVVKGGIWNGNRGNNNANNGKGTGTTGLNCIFRFYGVDNLVFDPDLLLCSPSYSSHVMNVKRITSRNVKHDCGSNPVVNNDGHNTGGNCEDIVYENLIMTCADDPLSISPDDVWGLTGSFVYPYYVGAGGPIKNVAVRNVLLNSVYYGVRLMCGSSRLENVVIENVTGVTKGWAILLDNYQSDGGLIGTVGNGNMGSVLIDGVDVAVTAGVVGSPAVIRIKSSIEKLTIRNLRRSNFAENIPTIRIESTGVSIGTLEIDGYDSVDASSSQVIKHIVMAGGSIGKLRLRNVNVQRVGGMNGSNLLEMTGGATIDTLLADTVSLDGINSLLVNTSGTVNRINATNVTHTSGGATFSTASTIARINLSGYIGAQPTSGTFTTTSGDAFVVAADTAPPTIQTAVVQNATPTTLRFTLSEALNPSYPLTLAMIGVSGHTASALTDVGGGVYDVTVSAFVNGEAARTLTITVPGAAGPRDAAGNLMATQSKAITNNVAAAGGGTATAIAYPNGDSTVANDGTNVWTTSSRGYPTGGYSTHGRGSTLKIPANSNGFIYCQHPSGLVGIYANFGFALDSTGTSPIAAGFIMYENTTPITITTTGGATTGPAAVIGNYYGIRRTGTTVTLETSANGTDWTVIHTFAGASTAELYPAFYLAADAGANLYHPMQIGLV